MPSQSESIAAQVTTVNTAALLVTLPAALVTTARYWAVLSPAVALKVYEAPVAPATFVPLRCHWYVIPLPVAATANVVDCPGITVCAAGCCGDYGKIDGDVGRVRAIEHVSGNGLTLCRHALTKTHRAVGCEHEGVHSGVGVETRGRGQTAGSGRAVGTFDDEAEVCGCEFVPTAPMNDRAPRATRPLTRTSQSALHSKRASEPKLMDETWYVPPLKIKRVTPPPLPELTVTVP